MDIQAVIAQLKAIIADYEAMVPKAEHKDLSDLPKPERQALVTRAVAAVRRIAGSGSAYDQEIERVIRVFPALHAHTSNVIGVVKALLVDVEAGHIQSLVELVHADTFGDYLEMAKYLEDSGFKDAAAVIAGSTLEVHLRALCTKHAVPTEITKADGTNSPKKAEAMNSDLAGAGVYNKLDQKSVTAWLDLRNKAAHGKYNEYTKEQVALLTEGVRSLMTRVTA